MAAARIRFLYYWFWFLQFTFSNSTDIITTHQSFKHDDILVSKGNNFAFGFFTPGSSSNKYLGIWFHDISERTIVWVANRNIPVRGSSVILSVNQYGNLVLYNDQVLVWSTNVTENVPGAFVAQLLDTGNLVLLETTSKRIMWESFDYPTDTLMPGMRIGQSKKVGKEWQFTSWRSADDPGTGEYLFKLNLGSSPQYFLYKGSEPRWRTHLWPVRKITTLYNYTNVINQDEMYALWHNNDDSVIIRIMIDHFGSYKWITWHQSDDGQGQWKEFWSVPKYPCDFYAKCGASSKCNPSNSDAFECSCLPGYEPKSPKDWNLRDASGGCVRKSLDTFSMCGHGEGFLKIENVKYPDTSNATLFGTNMRRIDCEQECLKNCSCSAYSIVETYEKQIGCLTWYGELIDLVDHTMGNLDVYVRADAVELAENARKSHSFLGKEQIILVLSVGIAWFTIFFFVYYWFRRRRRNKGMKNRIFDPINGSIYYKNTLAASELRGETRPPDITFFYLSSVVAATDNFSLSNKLGQGGFGSVYRGQLNGQEVAIKRVSQHSEQGIEEFKNEVMLIAKLQHRNLVKLLGCCIDGGEQMLIYEYLSNKSLDLFLFDQENSILDWRNRCIIINGVVRGILYLHQDSRLRIIHRDLKSSNILLDAELNPKISDFGMARIFRCDQIEDKTNKIVGTYGYMSPEYAVFGKFSTKSDVFSFGVITLEIITGKKNTGFHRMDNSLSLIGHVWDLWREGRVLEMVDSRLEGLYSSQEALRSIQIGLLCVQENVEDRPTMLEVVSMFSSEGALPFPKQPPFVFTTSSNFGLLESVDEGSSSINEVTITRFEAR